MSSNFSGFIVIIIIFIIVYYANNSAKLIIKSKLKYKIHAHKSIDRNTIKYKLLCPRGTQTCALAVANIKVNGNGKVILDTHPESDQHQNELVLEVHPLLPPTKFGGDP